MDTLKRGQAAEADKHAIRRKIEEKNIATREQRKVRERMSRECADTLLHIASTKSTIKAMKSKHQEALNTEREEFRYSCTADRREATRLEGKKSEMERLLASADILEREKRVLSERLAALRADDEKEEVANAREIDTLKRNLFNIRNELENAFRTTLHDLNVAYQEQAFDAMVEEADKAKRELPSLRKDLLLKTRKVNRVIATQGLSFEGACKAKAERDVTETFVKLQDLREKQIQLALAAQREVVAKEREETKNLGEDLEAFQDEAGELRAAAAELRYLRDTCARKRKECQNVCAWVHTLAKKGPQALKAELKRKRLATLKAATVASFKANPSERGCSAGFDAGHDVDTNDTLSVREEWDSEERNSSIAKTSHPETSTSVASAHTTTGAVPEPREGTMAMRGLETFDGHHNQSPRSSSRLGSDDQKTLHRRVDTTERIWRASLNDPKPYRNINKFSSGGDGPNIHGEHDGKASHGKLSSFQDDGCPSTWVKSSLGSTGVDGITLEGSDKKIEEAKTALAQGPPPAVRLDKLPAEVLASMLLSDQNFSGDKTSADVLNRVRQWETAGMMGRNSPLQPFPDLPYGFTNLARRLNDLNYDKHQDLTPEPRSPVLSEDASRVGEHRGTYIDPIGTFSINRRETPY